MMILANKDVYGILNKQMKKWKTRKLGMFCTRWSLQKRKGVVKFILVKIKLLTNAIYGVVF